MCGIAGFLDVKRRSTIDRATATVRAMSSALQHRGPDHQGSWVVPEMGIALGHQRLSIIDLSDEGHQPMRSASGRFVITYNGELYNFQRIRNELKDRGRRFRGHCDTEVLLAAIDEWGLEEALPRLNGMFAFAVWDTTLEELHLVRDRIGEKPLYYGWVGSSFIFGSELKALQEHPDFKAAVDRNALALYLRHGVIPGPHTIYENIFKLPAGSVLSVAASVALGTLPRPIPYWSLAEVAEKGVAAPLSATDEDAADQLEMLMGDAVALRMQADVPLGAFLSGGIDSSLVVALMQARSIRRIQSFTIGFEGAAYDESGDARAVAKHLGTEHTEWVVTPTDALEAIPRMPNLYDEPFADSSQVPTFLVSQMTRQHVTVSLSGDGGDELFGGYNRYHWCNEVWRRIGWAPLPFRQAAATTLDALSPQTWEALLEWAKPLLPSKLRVRNAGTKIRKLAEVLPATGIENMYFELHSLWKNPAAIVIGGVEAESLLGNQDRWAQLSDPVAQMMYLDAMTYLHDDILVKVDRATMGVSLEARVPFLDPRVIEFAWRLPPRMKIRHGHGKWLLRQVLYRHIPRELVDRPKMGFGLPIDDWLRGPLRPWAEDLLAPDRLRREGFLRPDPILRRWSEHLSGRRDWQFHLWPILMFQAWLQSQQPNRSCVAASS